VTVTINGERREVPPGTTVEQLVRQASDQDKGIAVALNGEVLPRGAWPGTPLADRDQLEVVTAVQGG
jgi:sulfur carrier protein